MKSEKVRSEKVRIRPKRLALEKCRETAPVTVEVRGNRVIETRGRACIGWKSCGHFSNKG